MYQLRAVPVNENCMKTIRRACQSLFSWSVEGCNHSENVTRASKFCRTSSVVWLGSEPPKGLIRSEMETVAFIYVGLDTVEIGIVEEGSG